MANKAVLIVDDSALVRKQLATLLDEVGGFDYDFAKDGLEAVEKATNYNFDLITMDINMPKLDGVSAVKEIMKLNPTPILMISSLTTSDAPITLEALDSGAVDFIAKPGTFNLGLQDNSKDIVEKAKAISRIPKSRLQNIAKSKALKAIEKKSEVNSNSAPIKGILTIGASTGAPRLIEEICSSLDENFPYPVCIVQHMPDKFTYSFAERLNKKSKLLVKESEHNEELRVGTIYIAKGGTHLTFAKKVSGKIVIRHEELNQKRFFTPSVDEMFLSCAKIFPAKNINAVILTGIGDDGAEGMLQIKNVGGYTVAESEESATVFGMPKSAINLGGVCEVLPFPKILQRISTIK